MEFLGLPAILNLLPLLLLIFCQTASVHAGAQRWSFTLKPAPVPKYTQCASYVTGSYFRHLYCTEGEVIYTLQPGTPSAPPAGPLSGPPLTPLTGCVVEYVDIFRRRLHCNEGQVFFGYVEGFILGTIHYQ